jgi:hypothetical protein
MSVASNPLLFTAVLGSNAFTGTNIAETTLNAEPMMKTGSASNPTGTNTSANWNATIYPIALGQINIYYITVYVTYIGPQSDVAIVIDMPEIPANLHGTTAFATSQATGYFTSAQVSWQEDPSAIIIGVPGSNTTVETSTMYINGIFCYVNPSTFIEPLP